jgi:6-pyruvoyltetrahydropterin/6-carboxytetrahydropterin synthase
MKRANGNIDGMNPKQWFDYLLDHTTIISEDDPYLEQFKQMAEDGIIQLRILPSVGAERFAEYLFKKINEFVQDETHYRVRVAKVEVFENGRNSASYEEEYTAL